MDDARIVEMFFARSEEAIAALDTKYGRLAEAIARNILGDARDAEECRTDTALTVWNTVPPKRPDPLIAYVAKIARNLAIDRYRYNRAAQRDSRGDLLLSELSDVVSDTEGPERYLENAEIGAAVSDFLRTQPEKDRRLFLRRYYFGDSVEALARDAGISVNNASVKLHRIRARLRDYLLERGIPV
jgi:RNA polymerase sigma-70 factor (ECF subfamily)